MKHIWVNKSKINSIRSKINDINQYKKQFEKIYALKNKQIYQNNNQIIQTNHAQPTTYDQKDNQTNKIIPITNITQETKPNKTSSINQQHFTQNRNINNNNNSNLCSCGSTNLFIDPITANKVCGNCGILLSKIFNTDAEWRYYGCTDDNKHTDPTRCGLPIDELLPKSSLTTKIKYVGTKYISLVRLHKWNIIHPEERSLFTVFKYIDNIFKNVNLSITNSAILQAKEYYKILSAKDDRKGTLTRGIIRKSFIAACIFVSCKNNQTPIQKAEIAKICGISKFAITKGFKKFSVLEKNKNIQLNKPSNTDETIHNYLQKFSSQLNFTPTMKEISHIICNRLPKLKLLQDTNDISISAGLLYYVSILFINNGVDEPNNMNNATVTGANDTNNIAKSSANNTISIAKSSANNTNNIAKSTTNHSQITTNTQISSANNTNNITKSTTNHRQITTNIQKRGANDIQKRKILNIINTSVVTLQKVYRILQTHKKYILIGLDEFISNK